MAAVRLVTVLLWFCAAVTCLAAQERRVALVIGNGAYASVGALDNPGRDAAAVAQALRGAGFQTVQVENDLGHDALLKALRQFEDLADAADWALVYYAGHGIEVGGVNYLVPVDARIRDDRDVEEEAVSLAQVQKRMEGARKLRLVILDACRDNPFLAKMRRTRVASRSVGRGLAVPDLPQTGSLVAYSAAAGQTALDGETTAGNSPYAAALVRNLAVPDVEVNLFFRRVRVDVLRATGNKQEPATYESLPDDRFVVRPAPPGPPIAGAPAPSPNPSASSVAALTPTVPRQTLAPGREALIDACDRLAAAPSDPDRPPGVAGVPPAAVDAAAAIPACRTAAAIWDDPAAAARERAVAASAGPAETEMRRVFFELGRSLNVAKYYGEAKWHYERAAALGSVLAMANLGTLYVGGQGMARDYTAARDWYGRSAAGGVALAMTGLGNLYANGWGVARDDGAARGWYEKAAAGGEAGAMAALGILYANGRGVARDDATARSWYERAAAGGNAPAMNSLGYLYQNGHGVAQDYGAARGLFERAAALGNAQAMTNLGVLYANGQGVVRDDGAARAWYEKAAAAGDANAFGNLGNIYAGGRGVARDDAAARGWYERAAAAGNAQAMMHLGALYANGQGGARDLGAARVWYEKAAAGGSVQAMTNLGYLCESGQGAVRDYGSARVWYEKAATAGSAQAMNNLGALYANGQGVALNYGAARGWYEKAAAGGNAVAMRNMGDLYANGRGVRRDASAARGWYEKAAAAGDTAAADALRRLSTVDRRR